jgi:hypothetical protein
MNCLECVGGTAAAVLSHLMFIECLQRELAVCHHAEIKAFLAADPGRWQQGAGGGAENPPELWKSR